MNQQDKIDQLEAQNRVLELGIIRVIEEIQDEILRRERATGGPQLGKLGCVRRLQELLSNSPDISLYRKEQELLDAAIRADGYLSLLSASSTLELCEAIVNLQQARKERE